MTRAATPEEYADRERDYRKHDDTREDLAMTEHETYLGDGLYASWDGWQVRLRAPRENGDHVVYLEDGLTLQAFLEFVANLPKIER